MAGGVAFNAPHTPLHTPTANCNGIIAGSQLASGDLVPAGYINRMIQCMDEAINWLLDRLDTIGELEKTTVIFIGDNGTDDDSILFPFDANPLSHKMEVYEGGIRVPFIISDGYHLKYGMPSPILSASGAILIEPGRIISPGRRVEAMVHTVDIFATVAEIAFVGVPLTPTHDSISMIPYLQSAAYVDQRQ